MSYNLLLDTEFKTNQWKCINCTYKEGLLTSTNKIFGIEQEIIIPQATKLYFRFNYIIGNISIKNIKIGIQSGSTLYMNTRLPKLRKQQYISIVNDVPQGKIKVHLIFESNIDTNNVQIEKPLLCDLNYLGKSTWLKWVLDRVLKFRNGYTYTNLYKQCEITQGNDDFKNIELKPAKIGSIIQTKDNLEIILNAKFIIDNYYLIKLNYEEINRFGNVSLKYGNINSTKVSKEQICLIFKAHKDEKLVLNIKSNDILPYQINLKHLMILDITKLGLLQSDVNNLPFV